MERNEHGKSERGRIVYILRLISFSIFSGIRVTGLVKLEDANMAGGKESNKCTLILTEGDSAKALVVSGFGAGLNRDYYGVYPLRGKLLNVRDANLKALKDNAEIVAVKQIMGLQQDKKYEKTDSLRYGSIMIMADQVRLSIIVCCLNYS